MGAKINKKLDTSLEAKRAWDAAAAVLDPEVPAVNVAELGILRDITIDDQGRAVASITPTYSGCPAVIAIEMAIETALIDAGFEPVIKRVISPAWTTDWITDEGREKLRAYGIAPPVAKSSGASSETSPETGAQTKAKALLGALFDEVVVACPLCSSANTAKISEFGSTACKAQYQCRDCAEPFDYFKCI